MQFCNRLLSENTDLRPENGSPAGTQKAVMREKRVAQESVRNFMGVGRI